MAGLSPLGAYIEDAQQRLFLMLNNFDPKDMDHKDAVEQDGLKYEEEDQRVVWNMRQAAVREAHNRGAETQAILSLLGNLDVALHKAPLSFWDKPSMQGESENEQKDLIIGAIVDAIDDLLPYANSPSFTLSPHFPQANALVTHPEGMMPDEIANRIGCSSETIGNWAVALELPARDFGKPFPWEHVEKLVEYGSEHARGATKTRCGEWKTQGIRPPK